MYSSDSPVSAPLHSAVGDASYADQEDHEAVRRVVGEACALQQLVTIHSYSSEVVGKVNQLLTGIVMLRQLFAAFRTTPRGRIRGEHGVAQKLGISPTSLYARLKEIGLTPCELLVFGVRLSDLIRSSRVLGPLVMELHQKYEEIVSRTP